MKRLLLTMALFCFSLALIGQINHLQTFSYSANITYLTNYGHKYFLMDVPLGQLRIYNTDFSLYKTLQFTIPENNYLYDVRFITDDLFNSDSEIECLYTYYEWVVTNVSTNDGYYIYHSKIVNESGTVLLDAPGVLYSYLHKIDSDNYGLFLYGYDNSVSPYEVFTAIYSIPGVPTNTLLEEASAIDMHSAYPNPADKQLIIEYQLPESSNKAVLSITNLQGQIKKELNIDPIANKVLVPTHGLASGTYLYYISNGSTTTSAKKIVVR